MSVFNVDKALAELQAEVSNCEQALIELIRMKTNMSEKSTAASKTDVQLESQLQKNPVAIVGMASIMPESKNLQEYSVS